MNPAPTFDRKAHCQRIGASGGNVTFARHGTGHMSRIGRVGAAVCIDRHGYAHFAGIIAAKGWQGRRPAPSLAADLVLGQELARLAA